MAICSDVTCEVEIIAGVHFYLVNEVMFSLRLFVCLYNIAVDTVMNVSLTLYIIR